MASGRCDRSMLIKNPVVGRWKGKRGRGASVQRVITPSASCNQKKKGKRGNKTEENLGPAKLPEGNLE